MAEALLVCSRYRCHMWLRNCDWGEAALDLSWFTITHHDLLWILQGPDLWIKCRTFNAMTSLKSLKIALISAFISRMWYWFLLVGSGDQGQFQGLAFGFSHHASCQGCPSWLCIEELRKWPIGGSVDLLDALWERFHLLLVSGYLFSKKHEDWVLSPLVSLSAQMFSPTPYYRWRLSCFPSALLCRSGVIPVVFYHPQLMDSGSEKWHDIVTAHWCGLSPVPAHFHPLLINTFAIHTYLTPKLTMVYWESPHISVNWYPLVSSWLCFLPCLW